MKSSLAEVNSHLVQQWHTIKNGSLRLIDVTQGSGKKVWWKCSVGDDHEWICSVNNRVLNRSGCPFCSQKRVALSNCLMTICPSIANEWHPSRNSPLTPSDIIAGSGKKVWWLCSKNANHEWEMSCSNRTRQNQGCPYCSGQRVTYMTCLANTHPEVAKQWHPKKNSYLTPLNISSGSNKKVWWRCSLSAEHEWIATCSNRTGGSGCPFCAGTKVSFDTCLAVTHPTLTNEWHSIKNDSITPFSISFGSTKKVWWRCLRSDDHEWVATCNDRTHNGRISGCPFCSNKKISTTNCLAITHPEISKEWHPIKNGSITPFAIGAGTNKKVWWLCINNPQHEWAAAPNDRTGKGLTGCPFCSNKKVITPKQSMGLSGWSSL